MAYDWSLATVAPNREGHVSEILSTLEIDHRVFRFLSRVPHNGQIVEVVKPVFPGYLFVKTGERRETISEVDGVVGFVKFGDVIIDVDRVVEDLDVESDGTCVLPWSDREVEDERFSDGDRVRVKLTTGNRLAVFSRYLNNNRCIVIMDFMGRMTPFTVAEEDLEVVEPPKFRRRRRRSDRARIKTHRQAA